MLVQTGSYWFCAGPDWFVIVWGKPRLVYTVLCWFRLVYNVLTLIQIVLCQLDAGPDWFILVLCWPRLVYVDMVLVQTGLYLYLVYTTLYTILYWFRLMLVL